jgi:hypothetical protein
MQELHELNGNGGSEHGRRNPSDIAPPGRLESLRCQLRSSASNSKVRSSGCVETSSATRPTSNSHGVKPANTTTITATE